MLLLNRLYSNVADVLYDRTFHFIRQHKMSFNKFCWSHEMNILKESSVALIRTWKVSGRRGRIYQNCNVDIKRIEAK